MDIAEFEIEVLQEPLFRKAFEVATNVFVRHSTLHRALGASLKEYRAYLEPGFFENARDGLSLVAIDRASDAVAGLLLAHDLFKPGPQTPIPFQQKYAPIGALGKRLEEEYLNQRDATAGDVLLVDMAAVDPAYGGQGLYLRMREAMSTHARQHGFGYVIGELSSPATQKVVIEKLGHNPCAAVVLADFEHEGKHPFAAITSPKAIILAEDVL